MISDRIYDNTLRSDKPYENLRAQVTTLNQEGKAKAEIVESLERLVLRLRGEGRPQDEELVLDVLDALGGWCHPSHHLLLEDHPQP